jgi:DNA-directed RNA polymerase subunit RPC12/RpoP
MTCKGICERHKALRPANGSGGRYSADQKRCQICEIFIKWDGLWCPCCGYRLRTKPKNTADRRRRRAAAAAAAMDLPNASNRSQLVLVLYQ